MSRIHYPKIQLHIVLMYTRFQDSILNSFGENYNTIFSSLHARKI